MIIEIEYMKTSEEKKEPSLAFGGQAVMDGVMIRSRTTMITCIRQQNGEILTISEGITPFSERHRLLQVPFIRGIPAMFETFYLGFKSLILSANIVMEEEGEKLTSKEITITIVMVIAIASFFLAIPLLLTTLLPFTGVIFNFVEMVVRLSIFLLFLKSVSLLGEYKKVLQYHGAEHKVINAYEASVSLNLTNVKKFSRVHPRCGNAFIFIVVLVSILFFSMIPNLTFVEKLAYRVVLIPVIGAVSYEILRFSDKHRNSKIMKIIITPGLWLQHLTTQEPDDNMIMVALKAVNEVNKLKRRA